MVVTIAKIVYNSEENMNLAKVKKGDTVEGYILAEILDGKVKVRMCSEATIRQAVVDKNINIVGFCRAPQKSNFGDKSKDFILNKKHNNNWSMSRVPAVDGSGELKNSEDAVRKTVIGWNGFAEAKKFYALDYKGRVTVFNRKDFNEEVKANHINGATYNTKTCEPSLCDELNVEIGQEVELQ